MDLPAGNAVEYIGALSGQKVAVQDGRINVTVPANSGEIWVPSGDMPEYKPFKVEISVKEETVTDEESIPADSQSTILRYRTGSFRSEQVAGRHVCCRITGSHPCKMANNGQLAIR